MLSFLLAALSVTLATLLGSFFRFADKALLHLLVRLSLFMLIIFTLLIFPFPWLFRLVLLAFILPLVLHLRRPEQPWLLLPWSMLILFEPSAYWPGMLSALVTYAFLSSSLRERSWRRELTHGLAFLALTLTLLVMLI